MRCRRCRPPEIPARSSRHASEAGVDCHDEPLPSARCPRLSISRAQRHGGQGGDRGARGGARQALHQEGLEGRRPQARRLDDGPHDARGKRHRRARSGRCAPRRAAPIRKTRPCHPCAAVCVYPDLVEIARLALLGSTVKVASVATAFPSGQSPLAVKLDDVRRAVDFGADEIDMVIDRGAMLAGDYAKVFDEIAATKGRRCGAAHLKVILETGELGTYDIVRKARDLAIAAGADFIKTSTGKVTPAATPPVTLCMLEAIRDHWLRDGPEDRHEARGRRAHRASRRFTTSSSSRRRSATTGSRPISSASAREPPQRRPHAARRRSGPGATRRRFTKDFSKDCFHQTCPDLARRPQPSRSHSLPTPDFDGLVGLRARAGVDRSRQDRPPVRALHRRQVGRAERGKYFDDDQPEHRAGPRRGRRGKRAGRRRRREGGARGVRQVLVEDARRRPCKIHLSDRTRDPGEGARARHRRVDGRRQADQGVARRRRPARGGALLLSRGLGRQARLRVPGRRVAAARRRRADHPVELPAAHGGVEDRAGARLRQHRAS